VVSLTVLLALTVLLVNCVTCCKEREVNFKVKKTPMMEEGGREMAFKYPS